MFLEKSVNHAILKLAYPKERIMLLLQKPALVVLAVLLLFESCESNLKNPGKNPATIEEKASEKGSEGFGKKEREENKLRK